MLHCCGGAPHPGNILQSAKTVTLLGCATQLVFLIGFGSADCFLLAIMAYDWYVAICNPLQYPLILALTLCVRLVAASVVIGLFLSLQLVVFIFSLPFCPARNIEHFCCDTQPVMCLASANSLLHEQSVLVAPTLAIAVPFFFSTTSYVFTVAAVLRIHSAAGRHRASPTCSFRLTVVLLYLHVPAPQLQLPHPKRDQFVSLVYTL
ncbi:olfactory receptor 10W1 [Pontoporia blainvillei]|uniref:Olfactory receptor 10W1 n=1 Tax=Pontoporia blainvillei TaxID=48723 RepID=A0ABX0S699_PONBL|nr:olfactory receptor 10W1 [Pontoporia blainvillei]